MVRIDQLPRSCWIVAAVVCAVGVIVAGREGSLLSGGLAERLALERRREESFDKRAHGTQKRIERKVFVVEALLAKRITFLEAAAHFRALDQMEPSFYWEGFRRAFPGATDEERHCREVICWIEQAVGWDDPCLCTDATALFEAELQDHLDRGPLVLPAIVPLPAADAR